jgi:TatD DNase family protein
MTITLIDTHAHLDDERFGVDFAAVLDRAQAAGVQQIVTVATTGPSTQRSLHLAQTHPMLFASAGIHPNHAVEAAPEDWDIVLRLVKEARIVGVGETGLDRHWDFTPFPMQQDYFARHLALSRAVHKPLIIHCREAETDILAMLREDFDRHGPLLGVMHSFSGDAALAEHCLGMGLFVSFAGMVTYKNAENLRTVAATIPAEKLLVETDSPYLVPVPQRGKVQRNEPAHVLHTAECLAKVRGIGLEELAQQTTMNARKLFGLPSS